MFKIETASAVVRFLANDADAAWEPYGDGVRVRHDDYDEIFTKEHLTATEKGYGYYFRDA